MATATETEQEFCQQCGAPVKARGLCRRHYLALVERERRADRISKGLCVRCAEPAVENRRQCAKHMAESNEYFKKMAAKRKAAGKCRQCYMDVSDGYVLCAKHRRRTRRGSALRLEKLRRDQKSCRLCNQPAEFGRMCASHRERADARTKRAADARAEGVCGICFEKPLADAMMCADCRESISARREALREWKLSVGQCVHCENEVNPGYKNCSVCRSKAYARKRRQDAIQDAKGLCRKCDEPRYADTKLCKRHRELHNNRVREYQRRKAKSAAA